MDSKKTVAVLGGGPCGLCAAWDLALAGHKVVVLERERQLGGQCRTNELKGYRFDLGGHRFISRDKRLIERVSDLMGDELLVSERKSTIRFQGKNYKYPLDIRDVVSKMNPLLSASCFMSYAVSRAKNRLSPQHEVTLEEWLVNRYGRELYEIFFKPYSTKLWGLPPGEISSDWASQRISLLNLSDVVLRLLRLKKDTPRTYAVQYFYPKKGIGDIFRRLGAEVERLGGKVVLGAEVRLINFKAGNACSVEYWDGASVRELKCDFVVSTLLLPDLAGMIEPKMPKEALDAASKLRFRSLRFMHILLDGIADISPYTWWYIQDGRFLATRMQEPKRRSKFSAPEGKTSVMLEIPCTAGDDVWEMDDKKLFERCSQELKEIGVDIEGKVVGYFTSRLLHAYPVYTLDYQSNRDLLLGHVRRLGNFVSCGREGLFDYIFMDDAMLMGFKAAEIAMGTASADGIYDRVVDRDLLEVKSMVSEES